MTQIVFNIPDDKIQLVLNAFARQHGYQEEIDDEPNPETKAQFAKRWIVEHLKWCVRRYLEPQYTVTGKDQAKEDADAINIT